MTGHEPGRGKSPAQRRVDVPAAPVPLDQLGELMRRPTRNTVELAPGPAQPQHHLDVPAAPRVVDVNRLIDRAMRGLSADVPGDDPGHLIG